MIGVPLGSNGIGLGMGTGFGRPGVSGGVGIGIGVGIGLGIGIGLLGSLGFGVVGGSCGGGVGIVGIGESGGTSTLVVVFFFFLGAHPLLEVTVTKEINNNGSNNSFIRNSTATRFTDVKSLDSTFRSLY